MVREGFSNEQYLQLQSRHIQDRIAQFGGKLYLEFGGKLFDDYHASRVLPGFQPDSKIRMLMQLRDKAEIIMSIAAADIVKNKMRGDLGISYDVDVLRLIDTFRGMGLYVGSVVVTQYGGEPAAAAFQSRLESLGIRVYRHYRIAGYPHDIAHIVSNEGYGKNDYIETTRPLVVVTAPGPGSGKMATCLSQLFHDHERGISAGYAKFETFPVWNLPLKHPVNLAYEAATADLDDVNMIDPFHLQAYGETTVNYNRDVEIYPVLAAIFQKIMGSCPYQSPTDMGVNLAGSCIYDDAAVCEASRQEIVRRYYEALRQRIQGHGGDAAVAKLELLMIQAGITTEIRPTIALAMDVAEQTGEPAMSIELPDGTIIDGKTGELMGCSASAILNALKALANIPQDAHLIAESALQPIQMLKTQHLGCDNPRLHSDEILIALAVSANTDPVAAKALGVLAQLKGCQAHCSVVPAGADDTTYKKLGLQLTCQPQYETDKLYHR